MVFSILLHGHVWFLSELVGEEDAEGSVPMQMSEMMEDTAEDEISSRCAI